MGGPFSNGIRIARLELTKNGMDANRHREGSHGGTFMEEGIIMDGG